MEIADLIKIVNESLEAAQAELSQEDLMLKGASIKLATTYDTTGSTGFKFLFINTGGEVNINKTHSVTYTFTTPDTKPLPKMELGGDSYLKENLINIIKESSKLYNINDNISTLNKGGFKVELSFNIKKKADGSFDFEFFNIGANISTVNSISNAHSITLDFQDLDNSN